MEYFSTRGAGPVSLDEALAQGIAGDGGLYLPHNLPPMSAGDFEACDSITETAARLLQPYFAGSALAADLDAIVDETLGFPIPVTPLPGIDARLLELYHGPTAAFKDVGAAFLAACIARLNADATVPLTILVATSGDTGSAVAAAFDQRPGVRVVVLYPDGRVSARQAHQLCCWSDNVLSLRVQGSFDDCQRLVKATLADQSLRDRYRFSSANSINIGRLLPQCIYYAHSSLAIFRETGRKPGFIIPTGNLGNAFACIMVREMGLPVGDIVLATNANRTIVDFLANDEYRPRPSIQTLASAMDVGDPSNMERLRSLLGEAGQLNKLLSVASVCDDDIKVQIRDDFERFGFATCPHTATATYVYRHLDDNRRAEQTWIIVATAHPAKFETTVEPLIGEAVALPDGLAHLLSRPTNSISIDARPEDLLEAMNAAFSPGGSATK